MIQADFTIATTEGPLTVSGFMTNITSMIGIHRNDNSDPWTVTFIPTGTKIDSIFPQRFESRSKLLRRITVIEGAEITAWLSFLDLPFGAQGFRPEDAPAVARIRAAAKL